MGDRTSPLAKVVSSRAEACPEAARAHAQRAWRETGLVLINPAWLLGDDRQALIRLAEKVHGARRA